MAPEQEENLRFQECFRDTTVRKEHRKAPWKHHKWHFEKASGTPPKAWKIISDDEKGLQMLQQNVLDDVAVAT